MYSDAKILDTDLAAWFEKGVKEAIESGSTNKVETI